MKNTPLSTPEHTPKPTDDGMLVLLLSVDDPPELRVVDSRLKAMQAVVGGTLDCQPLSDRPGLDVWFADDGIALGFADNPHLSTLPGARWIGPLSGTVFIARVSPEGATVGLTAADVDFLQAQLGAS